MSGLFPEQKTNDEYLSQTNSDIFEIASDGVYLALMSMRYLMPLAPLDNPYVDELLQYLHRYADWRKLDISSHYKRGIAVMNYGEKEVKAMEADGDVPQMSEEEALGKLAYEAYMQSEYTNQDEFICFDHLSERDQHAWIAVAKVVAERVLAEVVANEASGA